MDNLNTINTKNIELLGFFVSVPLKIPQSPAFEVLIFYKLFLIFCLHLILYIRIAQFLLKTAMNIRRIIND